ncbi:hypothetical protein SAMN04489799_6255 [Pseudomonas azotoformans]|nr:hypothetical protein SAMN04489799_6255 [Pseudomonas azotoformans]
MDKLLKAMADNRIEHVMISGIPVAKKWHEDEPKRPRYYAGDDADAYWYSATDVIVAAAVNKLTLSNASIFIRSCPASTPTTRTRTPISNVCSISTRAVAGHRRGLYRHDDLTAITAGDTPRANNEAMTAFITWRQKMTCR